MLRKASSRSKKKLIAIPVAGILAASILGVSMYNSVETAYAKASLPKIESMNQENSSSNPFTILEIVPDYKSAKIGYLVEGQEPAFYDEKGIKAIDDMASAKERLQRFPLFDTGFSAAPHDFDAFWDLKGKAFDWSTYSEGESETAYERTKSIYGDFYPVANKLTDPGDYTNNKNDSSSYKPVCAEADKDSGTSIKEILDPTSDESTGILYMDDAVINLDGNDFPTKYKLAFDKYDGTSKRPFGVTVNGKTYFDWEYYVTKSTSPFSVKVADKAEDEPADAPDKYVFDIEGRIANNTVLYVMSADEQSIDYAGYVKNDDTEYSIVLDDGSKMDMEGTAPITDISDPNNPYSGSYAYKITNENLHVYTLKQYNVDDDSDRSEDRFVIRTATENANCISTINLVDKNVRLKIGEDPATHGIDVDDPMDKHIFWYMPLDQSEHKYTVADDGTRSGDENFVQDFSLSVADSFRYTGGFTNKEWFKQHVLDLELSECSSSVIDVVTKLAKDVTPTDIANADLIYFQGGTYTEDMSKEAAQAIISSIKGSKPIAVEGKLLVEGVYDATAKAPLGAAVTQLAKVAVMLEQESLTDVSIDEMIKAWDEADVFDTYEETRVKSDGNSYTNRTVFVFSGDSKVTGYSIVCPDFGTTMSGEGVKKDDKLVLGYKDVIEDIENEKFYIKVAGTSASFNDQISIATCIRHIINFGDRRVVSKDTIRVLDIEPFYSKVMEENTDLFWNQALTMNNGTPTYVNNVKYDPNRRDIFDAKWFVEHIGTQITKDKVSVKGMGTREFIGNIDDLNANYDLIYIGLDTQYLNTETSVIDGNRYKNDKTLYNDNSDDNKTNGLVYRHIGDTMKAENEPGGGAMATSGTFATSGDDITFEKLRELQAYVEAGYAMLLSDEFYEYNADGTIKGVNTAKIDSNSYMYDLGLWLLYGNEPSKKDQTKGFIGKNVNIKKNFVDTDSSLPTNGKTVLQNQEEFSKYLSISKLVIDPETLEVPVPYYNLGETDEKTYQYLPMNKDGVYTLNFKVKLTNDSAVDTSHTSYDCKLYIDHDADGRFEDVEALNALIIADENGNAANFEDGKFKLTTGKTYYITRRVPEGYVGFLPWKLVFYENDRVFTVSDSNSSQNLVRTAIQGYSAVPDYANRPTIKILQITSKDSTATNLDLTSDTMKNLYNNVKDFKIDVDLITMRQLVSNYNNLYTGTKLDYLMQYDMVVMGFADMFDAWWVNGSSQETMYALRQYILSGRSMLFTHDLNSTYSVNSSWGGTANLYLRDLQGMDRYGVTQKNLKDLEKYGTLKEYKSRYDNDAYNDIFGNPSHKSTDSDGKLLDNVGWNNSTLNRYHHNSGGVNGYGDLASSNGNGFDTHNAPGYVSTKVTRVNLGQITEYPFHIEEEIPVASTHPQYFQLNLDTDSQDDNYDDDIVVWYTISNQNKATSGDANNQFSYYTMDYNDTRNNYYIYNKGNITYTGAGHSKVEGDAEMKLFVNTLVAAYNAGEHAPVVKYKESPFDMAVDITAKYEPYDINLENASSDVEGGFIEDYLTVHFKTVNNNLQNNTYKDEQGNIKYKNIYAQYYVEVPEGTNGAIKIGDSYYKTISPYSLVKVVDSNGQTLKTPEHPSNIFVLENYTIYTAKFNLTDLMDTVTAEKVKSLKAHNAKIYIRLSMDTTSNDMLKPVDVLPATDSMNPLSINFTELYELR